MNKFLKIISYILSLVRYVVWFVGLLLLVGVAGIFFGGQRSHGNFILDYGNIIIKVSNYFSFVDPFYDNSYMLYNYKTIKNLEHITFIF